MASRKVPGTLTPHGTKRCPQIPLMPKTGSAFSKGTYLTRKTIGTNGMKNDY